MRRITLLAFAALVVTAKAEVWTLDSCINYAIEHNIEVKMSKVNALSAERQVTDAKSQYLPSVSANASQSWNLGRGLTAQNTYANRNTSSFAWGANLSLPLFSGMSTTRQVALAQANLSQMLEKCEAAKDDVEINVITAYLQALYAAELHKVAADQVLLSQQELQKREALLEAGKIPEIDMLDAKAQLASDQLSATQTANDYSVALIDLAQLLNLGEDADDFQIAPLADDEGLIVSIDDTYKRALQHNHSILAARKGINVSDKSIAVAKSGYLPRLSFNGGVGSTFYKVAGFDNESFGQQMRHNYSTYFGFSLNVPIFDAFSTRNAVKRAEVEKLTAQLNLDQAEQQLFNTIQHAYYQAVGAKEKLASSEVAELSAHKAFDAMREKYDVGRATPTEYEQAKTKAVRTTAERIQSRYELILRTRILRFYAKLD